MHGQCRALYSYVMVPERIAKHATYCKEIRSIDDVERLARDASRDTIRFGERMKSAVWEWRWRQNFEIARCHHPDRKSILWPGVMCRLVLSEIEKLHSGRCFDD